MSREPFEKMRSPGIVRFRVLEGGEVYANLGDLVMALEIVAGSWSGRTAEDLLQHMSQVFIDLAREERGSDASG